MSDTWVNVGVVSILIAEHAASREDDLIDYIREHVEQALEKAQLEAHPNIKMAMLT